MGSFLLVGVAAALGLLALSQSSSGAPRPVGQDCSTPTERDEFEAWLLATTQQVLDEVEAEGVLQQSTPREEGLDLLRGHMHQAWADIPCDPAANVTTMEAWRMLGCSVAYQLALVGIVDEEPDHVLQMCDQGETFIPIMPLADEEEEEPEEEEYAGYNWEMWVETDGTVVDEWGYTYEPIFDMEVCPGDTLTLHTPAPGTPMVSTPPTWLAEVDTGEEGVYQWVVLEPEADAPDLGAEVEALVELYDEESGQDVLFGFRVKLSDIDWACAA